MIPPVLVKVKILPSSLTTLKEYRNTSKAMRLGAELDKRTRKAVRSYRRAIKAAKAIRDVHTARGGEAKLSKRVMVDSSGNHWLVVRVLQIGNVIPFKRARRTFEGAYGTKEARKEARRSLKAFGSATSR